jgi:hypothetical protein
MGFRHLRISAPIRHPCSEKILEFQESIGGPVKHFDALRWIFDKTHLRYQLEIHEEDFARHSA